VGGLLVTVCGTGQKVSGADVEVLSKDISDSICVYGISHKSLLVSPAQHASL
jgi:hypothetical protein